MTPQLWPWNVNVDACCWCPSTSGVKATRTIYPAIFDVTVENPISVIVNWCLQIQQLISSHYVGAQYVHMYMRFNHYSSIRRWNVEMTKLHTSIRWWDVKMTKPHTRIRMSTWQRWIQVYLDEMSKWQSCILICVGEMSKWQSFIQVYGSDMSK